MSTYGEKFPVLGGYAFASLISGRNVRLAKRQGCYAIVTNYLNTIHYSPVNYPVRAGSVSERRIFSLSFRPMIKRLGVSGRNFAADPLGGKRIAAECVFEHKPFSILFRIKAYLWLIAFDQIGYIWLGGDE